MINVIPLGSLFKIYKYKNYVLLLLSNIIGPTCDLYNVNLFNSSE